MSSSFSTYPATRGPAAFLPAWLRHPAGASSAPGEADLPFSPQNRMKTFLVLSLLLDTIIVIGGVVWLQKYNSAPGSTPLAYAIIAFGGLGVKELLVMLHTHQEARQTRHDLRGAINKTTANRPDGGRGDFSEDERRTVQGRY
jgi:hypothetical protein